MRFSFIEAHRSTFPVKKMCQVLKVSQSGYYRWRNRSESDRDAENRRLSARITQLYQEHGGMAGSPMITADLREEKEFRTVGLNRVARLMRQMGLRCRFIKRYKATTNSKHKKPICPNILDRDFDADSPNQKWVSDITYLRIAGKWYYLTVILDIFSRIVVGWDLSSSLDKDSLLQAFRKAVLRRSISPGLIFHSDRGVQYASREFRRKLETHGCIQSMSRKGNCWDNAVAESFFHTLKMQLIHHRHFTSKAQAEQELFKYIEAYYNRRRKHSANEYEAPAVFEEKWMKKKLMA